MTHGGDIYKNRVKLDFSVNINPLGVPDSVKAALDFAAKHCHEYPDMDAAGLREAISTMLSVPKDCLLFGNGASELFMGIVHAFMPKRTLIPVPSFYGYEYAANAVNSDIDYFYLKKEKDFELGEDLFNALENTELLFLANPNNPTGRGLDKAYLKELLEICLKKNIIVVLDESFIEFCRDYISMTGEINNYDNLLVIRSATKLFAIPGVRLGYMAGAAHLLKRIGRVLPEWNISIFAQEAGTACAGEREYIQKTEDYVKTEREFLYDGLKELGLYVYKGEANFLLFYSETPLYTALLDKGILIRDCRNFKGLSEGYYRAAVRQRQDNEKLLKAIGECIEEN